MKKKIKNKNKEEYKKDYSTKIDDVPPFPRIRFYSKEAYDMFIERYNEFFNEIKIENI